MPLYQRALRPIPRAPWICKSCAKRLISSQTRFADPPPPVPSAPTRQEWPETPARTRFAPSPTGYLHLGSLRTALFNYLLAKATGGQFLLRIEDTDQKRTVPGAEERLFRDLEWAGLEWDEGPKKGGPYGPYHQSQRTAIYREHAEKLLDTGRAYRCFCTPERLYTLAQERHKLGLPADYDRHCTHVSKEESDDRASKGEAHVVRLLSPEVYPQFTDIVHGRIRNPVINSKAKLYPAWSDPILLKSDGFPTYHLANVIDDHLMHITHVIRGSEWMSSTPKHLALYDAFSWTPPLFAHVGLLVDKDRQKLSKRKLDIDISAFRDKLGVFPEALNNYVALLGWSHSQTSDIMSLPALISNFSLKFTTGETIVAFEKLWFLQRAHAERYVRSRSPIVSDMVLRILQAHRSSEAERLAKAKSVPETIESEEMTNGPKIDGDYVERLLTLDARNYTTASDFYLRNTYYFHRPSPTTLRLSYPPLQLHNVQASLLETIDAPQAAVKALNHIFDVGKDEWMEDKLKARVQETIRKQVEEWEESVEGAREQEGLMKKWAKVVHRLVRWTLCAGLPGPDGAATMVLLGREEVLRRAGTALKVLEEPGDGAKGPKTEG